METRYVYLDLPGGERVCLDVPYVPPTKAKALNLETYRYDASPPLTSRPVQQITNMIYDPGPRPLDK